MAMFCCKGAEENNGQLIVARIGVVTFLNDVALAQRNNSLPTYAYVVSLIKHSGLQGKKDKSSREITWEEKRGSVEGNEDDRGL